MTRGEIIYRLVVRNPGIRRGTVAEITGISSRNMDKYLASLERQCLYLSEQDDRLYPHEACWPEGERDYTCRTRKGRRM